MKDRDLQAINAQQAMRLLEALQGTSSSKPADGASPTTWGEPLVAETPQQPPQEYRYDGIQAQALDASARLLKLAAIDPRQDLQACRDEFRAALDILVYIAGALDCHWPDADARNPMRRPEAEPGTASSNPVTAEDDY